MYASLRDTKLFFDIDGAGLVPDGPAMRERPTAFLIHGGPGVDHSGFKSIGAHLAQSMQLVYFDHRGQGRSARGDISKYTLDENVEDMEALRRYLGLGPIISIGVSYGGMVAMAHAARHPGSVSQLILGSTASHAGYVKRAMEIAAACGTAAQIALCDDLFAGRIDSAEKFAHYFDVMGSLYSRKYDPERAKLGRSRPILTAEALNIAHGPGGFLRSFDLRPELHLIAAPTLILAGRYDWICAPEFSEEIHLLTPKSELRIFEESSHNLYNDEPQLFLDSISEFLTRTRGATIDETPSH